MVPLQASWPHPVEQGMGQKMQAGDLGYLVAKGVQEAVHTRTLQREAMEEPAVAPMVSEEKAQAAHGMPLLRMLQRPASLEL